MKKTLSVKVAYIFLPAILFFLAIIFVLLSAWRNKSAIATEQSQLHITAAGAGAYFSDKDLDSITKENCMEAENLELYQTLVSLRKSAVVDDIYLMRKTNDKLEIIIDTQDDPMVESDRDEMFVDYSDAPEELLNAIESGEEWFTKKAYEDQFGTSISVFLPVQNKKAEAKYYIGVDTDVTQLQASVRRSTWLTVIPVFLFCLGCLTVIILIINVLFIRPLKRLSTILDEIANGDADLSVHIPVKGEDEIADTSKSFNVFVAHLNEMVVELKKRAIEAGVV